MFNIPFNNFKNEVSNIFIILKVIIHPKNGKKYLKKEKRLDTWLSGQSF